MRFETDFVAEMVGVQQDRLVDWAETGVVRPKIRELPSAARRYSMHDMVEVWIVACWRQAGLTMEKIVESWLPKYRALVARYPIGTYADLVVSRLCPEADCDDSEPMFLAQSAPICSDKRYQSKFVSVDIGRLVRRLQGALGDAVTGRLELPGRGRVVRIADGRAA